MTNWESIWKNRVGQATCLEDQIALDGFDRGAGHVGTEAWRAYVKDWANYVGVQKGQKIVELGVGSGAFLSALDEEVENLELHGVDYSPSLLTQAKRMLPNAYFAQLDLRTARIEGNYDHAVANAVIHYMDKPDVEGLLRSVLHRVEHTFSILDIPNEVTQSESERIRARLLPEGEYKDKYLEVGHTYFSPNFFETVATDDFRVSIIPIAISNYGNAPFRFSICYTRVKSK